MSWPRKTISDEVDLEPGMLLAIESPMRRGFGMVNRLRLIGLVSNDEQSGQTWQVDFLVYDFKTKGPVVAGQNVTQSLNPYLPATWLRHGCWLTCSCRHLNTNGQTVDCLRRISVATYQKNGGVCQPCFRSCRTK